jgi:fructose transport system substrate-binding protein
LNLTAPRSLRKRLLAGASIAAVAAITLAGCSGSGSGSSSGSDKVGVSLIVKTTTNPYFVSMEDAAKADAAKAGVNLTLAAGKQDGDVATQVQAIESAIGRGDKGILITPNGPGVQNAIDKARKAGLYVIALDTVPTPPSSVDITFATDNFAAGEAIGKWAAGQLAGKSADIAMLDLFNTQVVSVDIQRDHGFLEGMGIDPGSKTQNGQEAKTGKYSKGDYEVVCHQPTQGDIPHGKTAMETCLSKNPDINVVYTINEPAADGAYQALQAAGKKDVLLLTIDGSCKYIKGYVSSGKFAGDSAQYPGKMASQGVKAIADLARGGSKPSSSFVDTGTALVTKDPVSGVTSQMPDQATGACWGS